jgi:hypothetical protein
VMQTFFFNACCTVRCILGFACSFGLTLIPYQCKCSLSCRCVIQAPCNKKNRTSLSLLIASGKDLNSDCSRNLVKGMHKQFFISQGRLPSLEPSPGVFYAHIYIPEMIDWLQERCIRIDSPTEQ